MGRLKELSQNVVKYTSLERLLRAPKRRGRNFRKTNDKPVVLTICLMAAHVNRRGKSRCLESLNDLYTLLTQINDVVYLIQKHTKVGIKGD